MIVSVFFLLASVVLSKEALSGNVIRTHGTAEYQKQHTIQRYFRNTGVEYKSPKSISEQSYAPPVSRFAPSQWKTVDPAQLWNSSASLSSGEQNQRIKRSHWLERDQGTLPKQLPAYVPGYVPRVKEKVPKNDSNSTTLPRISDRPIRPAIVQHLDKRISKFRTQSK